MKILLADYERYLDAHKTGLAKMSATHFGEKLLTSEWFDGIRAKEMNGDFERVGNDAFITIAGPLCYKYDFWAWLSDGCSYGGLAAKIQKAVNDDSISRIILAFDTPGGEVTGLPEFGDMVYEAGKKKKCIGVIDPVCASAGYWIASQCSEIWCLGSGWVGSVGTQIVLTSVDQALKEAGYDIRVIRGDVGPQKNIEHPYEPIKDEALSYWQEKCNASGEQFIDAIARGRGVPREKVLNDYGKGLMLRGDEALKAGMVDRVGTLAQAIQSGVTATSGAAKRMRTSLNLGHI